MNDAFKLPPLPEPDERTRKGLAFSGFAMEAYARRALRESPCIAWPGHITEQGYGRIMRRAKKSEKAHIVVWESLYGPVPSGLVIDHVCRNRSCINPHHLEPVTPQENTLRGIGPSAINAKKTHCINGHEFNHQNTYITPKGRRHCKECQRQNDKEYKKRQAAINKETGNE